MVMPHYEVIDAAGPGQPWLVMVHGMSQHLGLFDRQVAAFRASHRLLLIDLPGHGGSADYPGPYGLVEYAAAIRAALDAAGVDAMHYWGTHTGAGAGLLLATGELQPRFKSLILDGPFIPGVDLPSVTKYLGRAKATARAHGIDAALREWFDEATWFDVMRAHPQDCRAAEHWAMVSGFAGAPWLDTATPQAVPAIEGRLAALDVPVLLINGEHELADFRLVADRIERALPNVQRYVVLKGGGFTLWEYPEQVNARVRGFLDGLRQ